MGSKKCNRVAAQNIARLRRTAQNIARLLVILTILYFGAVIFFQISTPQTRWNWKKINTSDLNFPKNFIWGVASAAHQVEGNNTNNQWFLWEHAKDEEGNPRIAGGQIAGLACDEWNRYPEDIQLIKELGVTSYRFSIEWSRIEPSQGIFDTMAISHYQEVCDSLIAKGITPMVTLHHFTNPIWFEEKGAFEKSENIRDFIEFVEVAFNALKDRVHWWCTINEPAVYVTEGYFQGANPPGKSDPALAAIVMRNILSAHVQAYRKIKSLPGGDEAQVGLVKNMTQMDPYNKWNLGDWIFSRLVDNVFNGATMKFLKTGKFRFVLPTMASLKEDDPEAIGSLDFIGLNYYSHYGFKFSFNLDKAFETHPFPDEVMTDMDYAMYPEGFYRAVKKLIRLDVPIIVTENGIADAKDDRRGLFIRQYLYALSKSMNDGADVKGYYYWSLMDNFEWSLGYDMKFGLYEVDFQTQERKLREGSKVYQRIIRDTR